MTPVQTLRRSDRASPMPLTLASEPVRQGLPDAASQVFRRL